MRVSSRFLDVTLDHAGIDTLRRPRLAFGPEAGAARHRVSGLRWPSQSMKRLAMAVDRWAPPTAARGNIEFFVDRLLRGATSRGRRRSHEGHGRIQLANGDMPPEARRPGVCTAGEAHRRAPEVGGCRTTSTSTTWCRSA